MGVLSGKQARGLHEALLDAFGIGELQQLVRFRLEERLQNITLEGGLSQRAFELIEWAEQKGRTEELIRAARQENDGNPVLERFDATYKGSIQTGVGYKTLEKIVKQNQTFKKARRWRDRLEGIERQVCRIERGGRAHGTGFLVAPDLVLTNHHVVAKEIHGVTQPDSLAARFDFQSLLDKDLPEEGRKYDLHADWLLDSSPHDPVDTQPKPKDHEPDTDHLDYAFLRLSEAAGEEALKDGPRGFVALPDEPPELKVGGPVFIVQHPGGETLSLALDTESITEINDEQTRVRHNTNTEGGSSGSPTFDSDWNLIALHHSGDPQKIKPEFNEGIPIETIRDTLAADVRAHVGWD